ncbi:putative P-loop containing nucleoside triphosphate hydrolase, leucine-rich repeat domain superfamily [Helianthus annuus]|nr:putative P-loop containing nucleoside triphosphate hydrolase, leucine-rich repeat domain superfamily [Helianthus annuus]
MGDPIVSSVINLVMKQSTSLATQDFAVLWGLKSDLRSLRTIFTQIQSVLPDAEIKQRNNIDLQNWLRKLRSASFQVENVLEEVSTEALLRRLHVERGIKNNRVREIKELLDQIAAERISFGLEERVFSCEVDSEIETRSVKATATARCCSEILGRDCVKEMFVEQICNDKLDDEFVVVNVYVVYGLGGVGKTTLAQMICNDSRVDKYFDLKIWLHVSNRFCTVRLLREILNSLDSGSCDLAQVEVDALRELVRERLGRRRFFMVLDGVENGGMSEWGGFMEVLKCGWRGSTVVVTTRSIEVADVMATCPAFVHSLSRLSESDCWLLFNRYAFDVQKDVDGSHGMEFETIGKAIVKKCEGLPLAVKVIGSLMCHKSSVSEWLSVLQSEVWDLTSEGSNILPSLKLSYDNLPAHMRQCFALCSIFPKGYEMDKQLLVELWVAYGFVPSRGDADLYDLGEEIFNSLVWRSFLQDVKECIFDGLTTCKMHDEMHALARSVMKYECSSIMSGEILKFPEEVLHLSSNDILYFSNEVMAKAKSLRSLITLGGFSKIATPDHIFEQRYLRVLHLGSSSDMITDLPESVGNLKFLRYLNVSRSKIVALPNSIVQLQNLQTLKLSFCENLCELPEGIRYLRNLRHLNIHGCSSLDHMPLGMGQLRHLRRLSTFLVGQGQGVQISELQELNLLGGEFSIKGLQNVNNSSQAESANLKQKQNINCLTLSWDWKNKNNENELQENNSEEVLEALQPHKNLKALTISDYQGSRLPNWIAGLVNLVSITFQSCKRCENLHSLGKLPLLKVLELKGMDSLKHLDDDLYPCLEKLVINDCPNLIKLPYFPKLKSLCIVQGNEKLFRSVRKLTSISFLEIRGFKEMKCLPDDAISNLTALEELRIWGCPNLRWLPDGIQKLEALKSLVIGDCELVKASCEKEVGVDWCNIAHIAYIKIDDEVMQCLGT